MTPCWPTLTNADPCWHMPTNADPCWHTLTNSDPCWPTLTNSDPYWPMLTNFDPCWPMLAQELPPLPRRHDPKNDSWVTPRRRRRTDRFQHAIEVRRSWRLARLESCDLPFVWVKYIDLVPPDGVGVDEQIDFSMQMKCVACGSWFYCLFNISFSTQCYIIRACF